MWARNLLFIGLCLAGMLALASSLAPINRPEQWEAVSTPQAKSDDFRKSVESVNAEFRQDWLRQGLRPAPRASDLTIARRITLALTGTVPSLEEIRMFEMRAEEGRLEWWVAGLLQDRRSSDYLAERFARTYVGVNEGPFVLFRRRRFVSWLSDELHQNRRYDELVRTLIASDGLWTSEPATNFVTAAVKPDSDEGVQENVMASRVSRAFLGVRLDCAECHDHPFEEKWKQGDFHGLAAFFGAIDLKDGNALTGIRDRGAVYMMQDPADPLKQKKVDPAVPFHKDLLPKEGTPRRQLAEWVTHPKNDAFSKATVNRVWALMFGRPLVEPVDNIPSSDLPPALVTLADDFVSHDYDLSRLINVIAATDVFRMDSASDSSENEITDAHEEAWASFPITRLRPEQIVGSVLQAGSLGTIDYQSHIFVRIARAAGQNEFVQRYGDTGEDEFADHGGTIPQRLLLMNGDLVKEKSEGGKLGLGATAEIARLASSEEKAVETAYLATLTRRPTSDEAKHFTARLCEVEPDMSRKERVEDLFWTLINSTEFSWNH